MHHSRLKKMRTFESNKIQVRPFSSHDQPSIVPPAVNSDLNMGRKVEQSTTSTKQKQGFAEHWRYRWEKGNIRKFYHGTGLTTKEVDDVVNALSVVNALILTIPFSTMMSLNSSFWDWLRENVAYCNENETFHEEITRVMTTLYGSAYSSMMCVLIAVLYYILRPGNDYFDEWWTRAKWAVAIIAAGTALSIAFILTMFGSIAGYYTSDTASYCANITENVTKFQTSVATLTVVCGICLYLMF